MSKYEEYEKIDIEIGNRIREERLCNKLSQHDLGIEIGQANGNQISKYEMGKAVPAKTLQKIAQALDVDVVYLQTGKFDSGAMIEMTHEQQDYIVRLLRLPVEYQNRIFGAITNFENAEKALQF